jgi:soluble lytic murein transglycosylase-like protein
LGAGFLLSLPLVLMSTPEEKQYLVQNAMQMRMVEQQLGLFGMNKQERHEISQALTQNPISLAESSEQEQWIAHVVPEILKFDPSEHEARSIAKWVWLYATAQHIDPALVLALITIESRFDPFATSVVGAQGLMQVMPFWKKELGSPNDDLFDVSTNIRYGCAILAQYIKHYKNTQKALAAYNGSKDRVKYPNKVFAQMKRYTSNP